MGERESEREGERGRVRQRGRKKKRRKIEVGGDFYIFRLSYLIFITTANAAINQQLELEEDRLKHEHKTLFNTNQTNLKMQNVDMCSNTAFENETKENEPKKKKKRKNRKHSKTHSYRLFVCWLVA